MDTEMLKKERLSLVHQTVRMETKPERILNSANIYGWANVFDKEPLSTVLRDYALIERDFRKMCEDYYFDLISQVAFRNIPAVMDPLENAFYIINDENNSVECTEFDLMGNDGYVEIGNDYFKYAWETMMQRKFPILSDPEKRSDAIFKSAKEYFDMMGKAAEFNNILEQEYGIPTSNNALMPGPLFGFDMLFLTARGIKPLSIDLRRKTDELIEACDKINAVYNDPLFADESIGSNPDVSFDYNSAVMCQNFLNQKQADRIYGPTLKRFFTHLVDHDKTMRYFVEGSARVFMDYLKDVPKGHLDLATEQDDIFEMRKQLPDICLEGGMLCTYLGTKKEEECIEYAKKLCNEIGRDGGYIFSQDKMMQFKNDAKPENLKAVGKFVHEYRG